MRFKKYTLDNGVVYKKLIQSSYDCGILVEFSICKYNNSRTYKVIIDASFSNDEVTGSFFSLNDAKRFCQQWVDQLILDIVHSMNTRL